MSDLLIDRFEVDAEALTRLQSSIEGALDALGEVGPLTKAVRKRLGWSQSQLADHTAIPVGRLRDIEAGTTNPTVYDGSLLLSWVRHHAPLQAQLDITPSAPQGVINPYQEPEEG